MVIADVNGVVRCRHSVLPARHIQDADAAFGTALLSDAINSTDPLIFFAGTNVGAAAAYGYGVARLSRTFLNRVSRRIA